MREAALVGGLVLLVGLVAALCFRDPAPTNRVRVAGMATPVTSILRWGIDQGFFAAEGLDVDFREQSARTDVDQVWNSVDAVVGDTEDVMRLQDCSARPIRMALILAVSRGAHAVLAGRDYKQMSDLKGKRIGTAAGVSGDWLLQSALSAAGLVPADVALIPLRADQVGQAIADHTIDAVVAVAPVLGMCRATGMDSLLYDSVQMPGDLVEVMLVDRQFLRNRSATIVALRRAWSATARAWLSRDKSSMAGDMKTYEAVRRVSSWQDSSGFRLIPMEDQDGAMNANRLRISLESVQRIMNRSGRMGLSRFDACLDGIGAEGE